MNNRRDEANGEAPSPCPVVGIGASAGGVKALQQFFRALPQGAQSMAFVVVVHLDPDHQSELAAILGAQTSLPVHQVTGRRPLEPGCVYVIAPNRKLRIYDHEIASEEFDEPRGRRAPIDLFFRSLAEQRGDGFAVVLTGAGSDGAVGVKAVKEAGGLILVQDPKEAEYPSMPRSAIATGVADMILPIKELVGQLEPLLKSKEQLRFIPDEDALRRLLGHLRTRTGHDFLSYKRSTVLRRVARRMQVHRVGSLDAYLKVFRENAEEAQALFADLLISVTTFFRDPAAFEVIARNVIPALFEGKSPGDQIRVWVPGCATGEEAYSIAILLLEEASRREAHPPLQVFASDLDTGALATAREGRFPTAIAADVSEERLQRFFEREGDHYRIKREVRDIVLFATHSLLKDPPFSRVDLISCRNLLIYLDRELQQQACTTLAYGLQPSGFLFLGASENADNPPGLFRPIDREARIYQVSARKAAHLPLPNLMEHPAARPTVLAPPPKPDASHGDTTHHVRALEEAAPPSALVNDAYEVVHLSETAGRYLQHPRGRPTADITDLARPELRVALSAALHRAFHQDRAVLSLPVAVNFNGSAREVYVQVRPVRRDKASAVALVFFIEGDEVPTAHQDPDSERSPNDTDAVGQLQEELHATRARLKANMEEHEASIEELRAANEELQSIGEEYRSTAEELETSKEELQSVNEELQTVNNELKLKLEAVSRAHSDLQNLISSTDVGTLFLDNELYIKRFTPRVSDLFNITSSDEGRPITDFTHRLKYAGFVQDARRVVAELGSFEQEVESESGRWYLVRIRPYRTVLDRIDGVVVTFVDITARLKTEADLRESEMRLRLAREAADLGVLDFDPLSQTMWWDERSRKLWDIETSSAGLDQFWAGIHADDERSVRKAISDALAPRAGGVIDCEFRLLGRSSGNERWVRMKGKTFFGAGSEEPAAARLVSTVQDISDIKEWELSQTLLLRELSHRVKNMLSIVQAMARQTLRGSTDSKALSSFEARLRALSAAHDLLVDSEWKGADLRALAHRQVNAHVETQQIRMNGPPVMLPPRLATPFGILVHELATNAVKYGSLSQPAGRVDLTWELSEREGNPIVLLQWQEIGGPPVAKPTTLGFGSYLIEQGLPEASVRRDFARAGLICAIELPLNETPERK